MAAPAEYNYPVFQRSSDFLGFRTALPVGSAAPDFETIDLATGRRCNVSDLWADRDLLLEFGSYTCPYCPLAAPAIEHLAAEYAQHGVGFAFVYTREAHPGENYPAIHDIEQKLAHARAFRDHIGVRRPILVDDVAGTGHRLYGCLPNMTYLINRAGKVLFRADSTDPPTIQFVLDYVIESRDRKSDCLRLSPFFVELVGYRWQDADKFMEGLARNGPQAITDWAKSAKARTGRRRARIDIGE